MRFLFFFGGVLRPPQRVHCPLSIVQAYLLILLKKIIWILLKIPIDIWLNMVYNISVIKVDWGNHINPGKDIDKCKQD